MPYPGHLLLAAVFAALTQPAAAFQIEQFANFSDAGLEAIQAHVAAVAPDAVVTADRIDFSDYGDQDGEFAGTMPFPMAGGSTDPGGVNDNFILRATGSFQTEAPGRFVFKTRNDDGVWLLIDDQVVIADGSYHAPAEVWGEIALQPGAHRIELFFIESAYTALMELSSEQPDGSYALVTEGSLLAPRHPDDPAAAAGVATAEGPAGGAGAAEAAPAAEATKGVWQAEFQVDVPVLATLSSQP